MIPEYITNVMLNLKQNDNQKIYWMADPHLGHRQDFVWESRGYTSAEHHTIDIINVTNSIVRPTDILFVLGDFCLNTPLPKFEEYLSKFQCQNIWMLFGNHNNPHEKNVYRPMVEKILKPLGLIEHYHLYPIQYKNVKYIGDYFECCVDGQMICMFHYPIAVWHQMQHGSWCLCGHSHCHYAPTTAENTTAKILDVGWDGYHKPLSFEEISAIMEKKQIPVVDHHVG